MSQGRSDLHRLDLVATLALTTGSTCEIGQNQVTSTRGAPSLLPVLAGLLFIHHTDELSMNVA